MTFVDTHAHIYLDHFVEDIQQVVERSKNAGINKILLPNIDNDTIDNMLSLEQTYPDLCFSMMGLHPCSVRKNVDSQLQIIESWLSNRSFIAIGEIGTDLYWDYTYWNHQKEAFHYQCELAVQHDLPVVIHCRESLEETINLIKKLKKIPRGVFHCFAGTVEQAMAITELGFYMGLGGIVTFKNGGMNKVLPHLDLTRIILETDSPYLSPVPERGKRNEPCKIKIIAEKIAEHLSMTLAEIASITTKNAHDLFFPS